MTSNPHIDVEDYFNSAPSAWKENREFANYLVERTNPSVILDLGVDWGHSTICWAEKHIGKVYGVDTWEPNDICTGGKNLETKLIPAFKSFREQGMDNIELIKGRHEQVFETWDKHIDILHFDILHQYDGVLDEYNMWKSHLVDGGVMIFHDVISFPDGVGRFFREYLTGYRLSFNNQFGLGVISDDTELLNDIANKFNVETLT
jgi:predicted O-methyltransferase YrrM